MMKKFIRLLLIKLVRIKTPMIRIETLEISFSGCLNKQQQLALRIKDFFLFIFGDAKCSHYFEWIVGSFFLGANGIQVPDEAIQQFLDGLSFACFSSLLVSGLIFS